MIVGIHQPQYLAWLPYFLKVAESDVFILLDSVDFQKNGLQNRNQIKAAGGPQWLTVPVKQRLGQRINEVEIDNSSNWRRKHWLTIRQSYGKSASFKTYSDDLEDTFSREWRSLSELNIHLFELTLRWLGLERKVYRSSEMKGGGRGSDLVLNLCLEVGAHQYLSGAGGHNYLDETAFKNAGVEVVFRSPVPLKPYPQPFPKAGFIEGLAAIDLILSCGGKWRQYVPTSQGGG